MAQHGAVALFRGQAALRDGVLRRAFARAAVDHLRMVTLRGRLHGAVRQYRAAPPAWSAATGSAQPRGGAPAPAPAPPTAPASANGSAPAAATPQGWLPLVVDVMTESSESDGAEVTFVSKYFRLQPDTVLSYLTRKGLAYRAMDAEKVPSRAQRGPGGRGAP
jgi:hypothetical protein